MYNKYVEMKSKGTDSFSAVSPQNQNVCMWLCHVHRKQDEMEL